MIKIPRVTGTDAKVRRGNGWGGKGSAHPTSRRFVDAVGNKVPARYYRPYRGGLVAASNGRRECDRRRAGGMRNLRWLENAA